MKRVLCILAFALLVVPVLGCDSDASDEEATAESAESTESDSAEDSEETAEEQTGDPSDEEADGDETAEDDSQDETADSAEPFEYPGVDLADLDDAQRDELQGLAESELCPCEGSTVSLHACMQQPEEERCEEADDSAASLLEAVAEGADSREAREQLARERAESQRAYEFNFENTPHRGAEDAEVTIVEFADFKCPHCKRASDEIDQLAERFGDNVAFYFKPFPLGSPGSQQAARAAMAAHRQNRFWPMRQLLFENQRQFDGAMIEQFARQLGMNFERFQSDLESDQVDQLIARHRQEGLEAGVQGTPAIFINGQLYTGRVNAEALAARIEAELDEG